MDAHDPLDRHASAISDDALADFIGLPVSNVSLPKQGFEQWQQSFPSIPYTRAIRFFAARTLLEVSNNDHVVDVGGYDGAFYQTIKALGAACTVVDKTTIHYGRVAPNDAVKADILDVDLNNVGATKVLLDHTFEHFAGDDDLLFMESLARWRHPKAVVCIEPFFVGLTYLEVHSAPEPSHHDPRAVLVCCTRSGFPGREWQGMGFGRIYDPNAARTRVLKPALRSGFTPEIVTLCLEQDVLPDLGAYFFKRAAINKPFRALLLRRA